MSARLHPIILILKSQKFRSVGPKSPLFLTKWTLVLNKIYLKTIFKPSNLCSKNISTLTLLQSTLIPTRKFRWPKFLQIFSKIEQTSTKFFKASLSSKQTTKLSLWRTLKTKRILPNFSFYFLAWSLRNLVKSLFF